MSFYFVGGRICVRVVEYDWYTAIVDSCIEYIVYARNNVVLRRCQFGQLSLARVLISDLYQTSGIEMGETVPVVVDPFSNSLLPDHIIAVHCIELCPEANSPVIMQNFVCVSNPVG
jgi:hypothetical protein